MVNNPLYPGYSPGKKDEESINPIYPGYYTGKPLPRIPESKEYLKPIEYNVDEVMEEIDNAGRKVLLAPVAAPRWVAERIVDDWSSNLKLTIGASMPPTDIDDYSTEDFPGAALTLSLNPKDWGVSRKGVDAEKAREQAVKTLTSWAKQATGVDFSNVLKSDFSDLENRQHEKLWTHVLGYGDAKYITPTERRAVEGIGERSTALFPDLEKSSPLNVKGVDIVTKDADGNMVVKKDIYKAAALAVSEFANQRDNPRKRDSLHTNFVKETVTTVNDEVQSYYTQAKHKNATNPARAALENHSGAIRFFDERTKTLSDMYDLQKNIDTQIKDIKKQVLGGGVASWDSLEKVVETAKATKEKRLTSISNLYERGSISKKSYDTFVENIGGYERYLGKLSENISGAKSGSRSQEAAIKLLSGNTGGAKLIRRDTFTESVAGHLQKELEFSVISRDKDQIGSLLNDTNVASAGVDIKGKAMAPVLYRMRRDRVGYATKELITAWDEGKLLERYTWKALKAAMPERVAAFTSGKWIENSLEKRNYFGLKIAVDEDDPSILKNPIKDPRKLARFEKKYGYRVDMDLDPTLFGVSKINLEGGDHFKILENNLLKKFRFDEDPNDADLFAKFLNGNKNPDTMEGLSQKFFGKSFLSLDPDSDEAKTLQKFSDQTDKLKSWSEGQFGDKIKGALPPSSVFLGLDPGIFGVSQFTLTNGKHLSIFDNDKLKLFDLSKKQDADLLKQLLGNTVRPVSMDILSEKLFGKGKKLLSLGKKESEELVAFTESIANFNEWIEGLRKEFGDKVDSRAFRYQLFLRLREGDFKEKFGDPTTSRDLKYILFTELIEKNKTLNSGYTLTRKYIGRLEKVHNRVLTLQKKWEGTAVGKTIKVFSNWKTIVSEKAAALVSKLIAKILGAAAVSTGVLTALMPIIEKVAEFLIKKTITYVESFIKAALKMDFEKFGEMFRKDVEKVLKSCLIISTILVFPVIILPLMILGSIGSSTSPIDPTRSSADELLGSQYPPGENAVVKIEKDVYVKVGGIEVKNPKSISNEQATNASFRYVVKITPKITMTDGSVSWFDIGKYTDNGGASSTFYTKQKETLYLGKPVVIELPSFNLGSRKDTLVTNTASVNTPAIDSISKTVSFSRYFRVGDFVPQCPLTAGVGTYILTRSFNGTIGHGSEVYWRNLSQYEDCTGSTPETCYAFAIPWVWYKAECPNGAACSREDEYYGYALDVSATDNSSGNQVTLPPLGDTNRQWEITYRGQYSIEAKSPGWRMYFTHLELDAGIQAGQTYTAGTLVGGLHPTQGGAVPHLHIELINMSGGGAGVPVKPECHFCSSDLPADCGN